MNNLTNRPAIAAVLLDLDGTLLDTAPDLAATVNVMRTEAGLPEMPAQELRHLASWGARGMLGTGLSIMPDDARYDELRERFIELYRSKMTELSQPFAGTRETILALHEQGMAWGVITNKYESLAVPLMQAMNFDPPPACIVGGDSAAHAKPHPAPMYLACEQAGLDPAACVYVGDSDRDIEAGRAAGMLTVAAAYGYIAPGEDVTTWQADAVIQDIRELVPTVNQLNARIISAYGPDMGLT